MLATIVEKENIYRFLESLRKKGINAYILHWAFNEGDKALIIQKSLEHIKRGKKLYFNVSVENMSLYTQRALEKDFNIVSNNTFKKKVQ
jgi:hypothetical protein